MRVYKRHWPESQELGDVRFINFDMLGPSIDIIAGGFPCQDISLLNTNGEGINGSRSGLWSEYHRAIRILRPRFALIENVPALAIRGLDQLIRTATKGSPRRKTRKTRKKRAKISAAGRARIAAAQRKRWAKVKAAKKKATAKKEK